MKNCNTPKKFGRVVVLMGGQSGERDISLSSGEKVLEALLGLGVDAFPLDVGNDVVEKLQASKPDRAFVALHGPGGEDGVIQGVLECMHIPYTGSGVEASALAMNKLQANIIKEHYGLPVIPTKVLTNDKKCFADVLNEFGLPLCIKPSRSGSTIGVSKVTTAAEMSEAYFNALKYDNLVIVEPWVTGSEFTVGIFGQQALPPIEIVPAAGFYDYSAKYLTNTTSFLCPSPSLSTEETTKLQELALKVYEIIGCRHLGRVDFLRDAEGKFWILELNTIPGLTDHSLVPQAAKVFGFDFPTLIWKILEFTL